MEETVHNNDEEAKKRIIAGMTLTVLLGFVMAIAVQILIIDIKGLEGFSETMQARYSKGLVILITLGILTSATLGGLHSARPHWRDAGGRLFITLAMRMLLRFVTVYLAGRALGIDHIELVAAGFMATDPIGTEIAIGISKKVGPSHLDRFNWPLSNESFLNDALAIVGFSLVLGTALWSVGVNLSETLATALLLGLADAGARLAIRVWFKSDRVRRYEAYIEIMIVFGFVYPIAVWLGNDAGLILILMGAGGAILGDAVLLSSLQAAQVTLFIS